MNIADHDMNEAFQSLKWLVAMGATDAIGDASIDRTQAGTPAASEATAPSSPLKSMSEAPAQPPVITAKANTIHLPSDTISYEDVEKATTVEALYEAITKFSGCNLKRTAMTTVFADGNAKASVMIIGDAPGSEEDRAGKPFVGDDGILLDNMLKAIGWSREQDVYITNILPWRPLGKSKPNDQHINLCLPFVTRHIELVKPKMLLLLGDVTVQALTPSKDSITKTRGKWFEYKCGETIIPAIAMSHPSTILRQPRQKALAWRDLLDVKARHNSLGEK